MHICRVFVIKMSVLEIYNEQLNDLLDPVKTNLNIREDGRHKGVVAVEGLTEAVVATADMALNMIEAGQDRRKVGDDAVYVVMTS